MEDSQTTSSSQKGKKCQAYSLEVKKKAIEYAELHGNRPAARFFKVHEKRIREWKSKKSDIEALLTTAKGKQRKRLSGGGRRLMNKKLDENLLEWIRDRHAQGLDISSKLVMKKAESIHHDLTECSDASEKVFKASRGWLSRFMERNGLSWVSKKVLSYSESSSSKNSSVADCASNFPVEGNDLNEITQVQLCNNGNEMLEVDVSSELQTHALDTIKSLIYSELDGDEEDHTAD